MKVTYCFAVSSLEWMCRWAWGGPAGRPGRHTVWDMDCRGIKEGLHEIVPEYVAGYFSC